MGVGAAVVITRGAEGVRGKGERLQRGARGVTGRQGSWSMKEGGGKETDPTKSEYYQ